MRKNKLEKMLNHLKDNVPYYYFLNGMGQINKQNSEEILRKLPIIDKKIISEERRKFINANLELNEKDIVMLQEKANCNNGESRVRYRNTYIYYEQTSGSTGEPFGVIKSHSERVRLAEYIWRERKKVMTQITPQNVLFTIHTAMLRNTNLIQTTDGFDTQQLYEYLVEKSVYVWHTNLRFVKSLMEYCKIHSRDSKKLFKYVELTGLYVSEQDQAEIENFFDCVVFNFYATIETWLIAYSKVEGVYLTRDDLVIVDLIDDNEEIIVENNVVGKIVVTSLELFSMPIIRYRTGDLGEFITLSDGTRGLKILQGRESDIITGTQHKYGNIIFRDVIRHLTYTAGNDYSFKRILVEQQKESTSFKVTIFSCEGDRELLEQKFIKKANKYLSNKYHYIFEYKDDLQTTIKDKGVELFKNLNYTMKENNKDLPFIQNSSTINV